MSEADKTEGWETTTFVANEQLVASFTVTEYAPGTTPVNV
jgi:hypothetical protein